MNFGGPATPSSSAAGEKEQDTAAPEQVPGALREHVPPMYAANAAGIIVFRTPAFDTLGATAFDTYPADRQADCGGPKAAPRELLDIFNRLNAGEKTVTTRQRIAEAGGGYRYYRSRHFRITLEDQSACYAGTYADVTDEINDALGLVNDAAPETGANNADQWTWECDRDMRITFMSGPIAEQFPLPLPLLGDGHRSGADEFMFPFQNRGFLIADKVGAIRRLTLRGVPRFDEHTGRCTGYEGTGFEAGETDRNGGPDFKATMEQLDAGKAVAELRAQNFQLESALSEARYAAQAKTDFLGKMSHELRTPLNAIIGFSEISVQQAFGVLNPRYLGYFRDIHGAAHHLLNIINDILDAVNVDSSKISITAEPVRLSEIIAEARSIIAVRAEKNEVDISLVGLPPDWVVKADPGRTRQIIVNLLGNAVKFTGPGGSIGMDARNADDGMIEFTVWDTGIGIASEQHARIFESFHQANSDILRVPVEGTGLGLSISRQLARLMGGEVSVDSQIGHGARFTVRLPGATAQETTDNDTAC